MHPFTVVADPVRRRIVEVLAGGERTAGELVAVVGGEFGISQSAVSQQLKVLRDHGFARVRPAGARRIYALEPTAVAAMDEWLRAVSGFWADRLGDLAAEVERRPGALVTAPAALVRPAISRARIDSVTRTVRDTAESVTFYGDVVGLPHIAISDAQAAFGAGGTRLLLVRQNPPSRNESLLAFAVRDVASSVERMRAAGVVFRELPLVAYEQGAERGSLAAYFDDPEGRPLALVAQEAPES
jgi:DNA-binding transcriptional ArsR family regulator/catechol 2,3-dioxygenase-like lactoylglutathione lyase family enzyme